MPFKALILDYGGVLSLPQSHERVASMAKRLDSPVDAFERAYHEHRDGYDAGLYTPEAYWMRVLDRLDRQHLAAPSRITALIEEDVASWGQFRDEVWAMAKAFRSTRGRTALLSNNVPPLMAWLRALGRLEAHFDVVMPSCELGFCKPDPRIYRACLEALDVRPTEALLVDDTPANTDAASELGIQTLVFAGDDAIERLQWMLT
ncbi:MAG TPA: HAD family phosphatase [Polyangiaceae bacterium]